MEEFLNKIITKFFKAKGSSYSAFDCAEKFFYEMAQYFPSACVTNVEQEPNLKFDLITAKKDGINIIFKCEVLHDSAELSIKPEIKIVSGIDELKFEFVGALDFCTRVLDWTSQLANECSNDEYFQDIKNRCNLMKKGDEIMRECVQEFNHRGYLFDPSISLGVFPWRLNPKAVANFTYDSDLDHGIINLNPMAFSKGEGYLTHVIKHELIHAFLFDPNTTEDPHGESFQRIADDLNLPKIYQD